MNVNVNETHPNFGVSHSHSKSSKISGSGAQAQAQSQTQAQTQTQGPASRTRATKKRRLKPLQDVASTSTSLSPRPLQQQQQQQKVLYLYCPPHYLHFYFIINNNGVRNFSCWLHFHVGIIYYCYYIFSCSQNVNFVVGVRFFFFFLGESESTNKGLNETWYRFLLTVTNDFDLYNAIIVSSFTASGNINLPILGSTIKFFVVE